jgi:uncharacterized protein with HEPN domain
LQGWFVRNLQIIGEAARALPDDVRALGPDIEWPKIIGMRNVLVHGHFDIDTDLVWDAASRDAVALKPRIEELLRRLEGQSLGALGRLRTYKGLRSRSSPPRSAGT